MRQADGLPPISLNRHPGLPPGAGMIQAFGLLQRTFSSTFTGIGDVGKPNAGALGYSQASLRHETRARFSFFRSNVNVSHERTRSPGTMSFSAVLHDFRSVELFALRD